MKLEHGQSEIVIEGQIIHVRLIGAFNDFGANEYIRKVKQAILSFENSAIVMLIDDRALDGGTPESYQLIDEYNQWCKTQNILGKAIVTTNIPSANIIQSNAKSYLSQDVRFFNNIPDALQWLNELLDN